MTIVNCQRQDGCRCCSYPSGTDNLSESFVDFFINKIVRIRNDLDTCTFSRIPNDSPITPCSTETESCLVSQFLGESGWLIWESDLSGYVSNLYTKSCALDPVSSSVFQRCRHRLVPIITRIVNLSLQGGQVPDRFKVGVIKPLGTLRNYDGDGNGNVKNTI